MVGRRLLICLALTGCGGDADEMRRQPLPEPDGRAPLLDGRPRTQRTANYQIDATYDPSEKRIRAQQTLTWTNSAARNVDELCFHLYMNAFKNDQTVFMVESRGQFRTARASDTGWGWIEVNSVRVGDGADLLASTRTDGPDETVMTVPVPTVAPGATAEISMEFEVQLPETMARTGWGGDFAMAGQWFPKIGVLAGPPGRESWQCEPFHAMSEFFADFGTYDVTVRAPQTHVIAATGVLVSAEDGPDGVRAHRYRAEDVHDFAWMADPFMEVMSGMAQNGLGEVEVRVYYRPNQRQFARRHLSSGIGSIEIFSRLYGDYPWPIMSIIAPPPDAEAGAGGMEYPMLVTTAGSQLFPDGARLPEMVTVHEVGHNWFQGLLASNEVEEAWLDEGVNSYADGVVMAELYGNEGSLLDWAGFQADYFRVQQAQAHVVVSPDPITTPSYRFVDPTSYGAVTYARTAVALATLEGLYGRDRFNRALGAYARRFAFRHPRGEDLFATLEAELGEDLSWFIEPAFRSHGGADLRVRSVTCRRARAPKGVFGVGEARRTETGAPTDASGEQLHRCEVVITNLGRVPVPVEIELTDASGATWRETWNDRGQGPRFHRIEVERTSPVESVIIDPDHKVFINRSGTKATFSRRGDRGAAGRAGARAQFWTQTTMQVLGL